MNKCLHIPRTNLAVRPCIQAQTMDELSGVVISKTNAFQMTQFLPQLKRIFPPRTLTEAAVVGIELIIDYNAAEE